MRQTLGEYIEGRLALGGCGLAVIGVVVFGTGAILAVERFLDFLTDWSDYWSVLLALGIWIAVMLLTGFVGSRKGKNSKKISGSISTVFGAVQMIVAVWLTIAQGFWVAVPWFVTGGILLIAGYGVFMVDKEESQEKTQEK